MISGEMSSDCCREGVRNDRLREVGSNCCRGGVRNDGWRVLVLYFRLTGYIGLCQKIIFFMRIKVN